MLRALTALEDGLGAAPSAHPGSSQAPTVDPRHLAPLPILSAEDAAVNWCMDGPLASDLCLP